MGIILGEFFLQEIRRARRGKPSNEWGQIHYTKPIKFHRFREDHSLLPLPKSGFLLGRGWGGVRSGAVSMSAIFSCIMGLINYPSGG
jgi:hypothetical protein